MADAFAHPGDELRRHIFLGREIPTVDALGQMRALFNSREAVDGKTFLANEGILAGFEDARIV
ncbi:MULTISPECIES: hypothetical protein [Rhodomicrobium]|uniref:hypothetical protein n=1 Tax=Rhodomicrobium TaxID=1068 RepID=UPI000F73EF40|nr:MULTISPECIES: hypothetical protein [Rhodomicrobium]